jgi:hypothetical protein
MVVSRIFSSAGRLYVCSTSAQNGCYFLPSTLTVLHGVNVKTRVSAEFFIERKMLKNKPFLTK